MADSQDLVSIISPAYNAEKTIIATIKSVQAQTHQNWEMLIGDDGSADGTIACVEQFLSDHRIKLFKNERNLGPAGTRNALLEKAAGRYIAFLDVDDSWLPAKLEKQLSLLAKSGAMVCCSGYRRQFESKFIDLIPPAQISYADMLKSNRIPMLTAIVDVSLTGPFRFEKKGHEDYQLWLNLLRSGGKAVTVPEVLATYSAGVSGSVSGNKFKAARWHWDILSREPISFLRRVFYFTNYILQGLRKNI